MRWGCAAFLSRGLHIPFDMAASSAIIIILTLQSFEGALLGRDSWVLYGEDQVNGILLGRAAMVQRCSCAAVQQCSSAAAGWMDGWESLLLLLAATKIGLPRAEICQYAPGSTAMQQQLGMRNNHECECR